LWVGGVPWSCPIVPIAFAAFFSRQSLQSAAFGSASIPHGLLWLWAGFVHLQVAIISSKT
jgi:hypothetical protein